MLLLNLAKDSEKFSTRIVDLRKVAVYENYIEHAGEVIYYSGFHNFFVVPFYKEIQKTIVPSFSIGQFNSLAHKDKIPIINDIIELYISVCKYNLKDLNMLEGDLIYPVGSFYSWYLSDLYYFFDFCDFTLEKDFQARFQRGILIYYIDIEGDKFNFRLLLHFGVKTNMIQVKDKTGKLIEQFSFYRLRRDKNLLERYL